MLSRVLGVSRLSIAFAALLAVIFPLQDLNGRRARGGHDGDIRNVIVTIAIICISLTVQTIPLLNRDPNGRLAMPPSDESVGRHRQGPMLFTCSHAILTQ